MSAVYAVTLANDLVENGFDGTSLNPIDAALILADHVVDMPSAVDSYAITVAEALVENGFDGTSYNPIDAALLLADFVNDHS